jgi:hypothetical protein
MLLLIFQNIIYAARWGGWGVGGGGGGGWGVGGGGWGGIFPLVQFLDLISHIQLKTAGVAATGKIFIKDKKVFWKTVASQDKSK